MGRPTRGGTGRSGLVPIALQPEGTMNARLSPVLAAVLLALLLGMSPRPARADHIVFRGDYNYPPYEFLDNGIPSGFNVDITRAVAQAMGLHIQINLGPWHEVREQVERGEINALTGMFLSAQRARLVDFSMPHITVSQAIFVRRGSPIRTLKDLAGREVLVQRGDLMHDFALANLRDSRIITAETAIDALAVLASGRHDAALAGKLQGLFWIEKRGMANLVAVGPSLEPSDYCFAVRKGDRELLTQLNEGLALIRKSGKYQEIYDKWFGAYEDGSTLLHLARDAAMILAPLLAFLAVFVLWTWLLRRKVRQKTMELTRELAERRRAELELVRARDAAEAASRTKNEFLANMSHELRTPLNGIMGMLQLMHATILDNEQNQYAEIAIQSCRRLDRLLGDILDLSRIEAGKMDMAWEPFDPADSLRAVEQLFSPAAGQKGIELDFHMDPAIPRRLLGDDARLHQVLNNLVGNALKFTDSGSVAVRAWALPPLRPDQCRVLLCVADTGIGIPDHKVDELFAPFTQAEGSYTRRYQGAGLGLSIVKRIVTLMGGTITVDSSPGSGTTIYVGLAYGLPRDDVQAAPAEALPQEEPRPSSFNVLVAEDDPVNLLAVSRLLEKEGCLVARVMNGNDALARLREQRFDLVIMDIQMPGLDGLEATRAVRAGQAGQENARIPIVALTGFAMDTDRRTFLEAGMDDHLPKPVEADELRTVLRRMRTRKQAAS